MLGFLCLVFHCLAQNFNYLPFSNGDVHISRYAEFTLSYNNIHRQPNWVAYELTASELQLSCDRKNYFRVDHTCGTCWAALEDYKRSGYDRGHLCRAEFCMASEAAYRESFLLSNISPQIGPSFNRTGGIWYNLEELEMNLATRYGAIYSVSGPVFKDNLGAIGRNRVTVPGYFFKAFLLPDYTAEIGFLVRHQITDKGPMAFAITIDSLEAFTGIDFFPSLPDSIEGQIEGGIRGNQWQTGPAVDEKDLSSDNTTSPLKCKAIAKTTGRRCTRARNNPDGYCWQHENQFAKDVRESVDIAPAHRCKAITKSGKQCKRSANATGYCWQHAGGLRSRLR